MHTRIAKQMRRRRADLDDVQYADLQAIRARANAGLLTQLDLQRWAALEPFRPNFTTVRHKGENVQRWRVDCQVVPFGQQIGFRCRSEREAQRIADQLNSWQAALQPAEQFNPPLQQRPMEVMAANFGG